MTSIIPLISLHTATRSVRFRRCLATRRFRRRRLPSLTAIMAAKGEKVTSTVAFTWLLQGFPQDHYNFTVSFALISRRRLRAQTGRDDRAPPPYQYGAARIGSTAVPLRIEFPIAPRKRRRLIARREKQISGDVFSQIGAEIQVAESNSAITLGIQGGRY